MSILIKGMEMPTRCGLCPMFCDDFNDYCSAAQRSIPFDAEKPDWCPITPIPEKHGRLGDLDAFKADCLAATKEAKPDFIRYEDWLKSCAVTMSFCRDIDERPTIVPAEGGKIE